MKLTYQYVRSEGEVCCLLPAGSEIILPVIPGLLKHPSVQELFVLLQDGEVARKYTMAALHKAPWAVLRLFPREWLLSCLAEAQLPPARARALEFLLH